MRMTELVKGKLFTLCYRFGWRYMANHFAHPALKQCGTHWWTRKEHQAQRDKAFAEMKVETRSARQIDADTYDERQLQAALKVLEAKEGYGLG